MRSFKYAIFDMDGTILDSMPAWNNLGRGYLIGKGIKAPSDLNAIISAMSMSESAHYFKKEFGLSDSQDKIIKDINKLIENKYIFEMPLKPYAYEYLSELYKDDIVLCLATATSEYLAEAALKRLDVLKYFSFIISCDEVGVGKSKPDIFYLALDKMKADILETVVFEDADYAMKTAKDAGFYTIGVADTSCHKSREEMKLLCHRYIDSFKDLLEEN